MTHVQVAANPFALMTNPEAVFAAMAKSDRLQRLASRMCRPLDKVQLPKSDETELATTGEACDGSVDVQNDSAVELE